MALLHVVLAGGSARVGMKQAGDLRQRNDPHVVPDHGHMMVSPPRYSHSGTVEVYNFNRPEMKMAK
jgi:hypothetical protein